MTAPVLATHQLSKRYRTRAGFAEPLVKVDLTHALVVVAIYAAVFLVVSMVLTARRDVLP